MVGIAGSAPLLTCGITGVGNVLANTPLRRPRHTFQAASEGSATGRAVAAPTSTSQLARPASRTDANERLHVKVLRGRYVTRAILRAGIAAVIASTAFVSAPLQAGAITRSQVVTRAKSWVKKRVPYSQSRYFRGYRQDCSGFVSMAWGLGRSYTTRSIASRARRVRTASIRPGDAVLVPGHVSLFGGWKNRRKRQYIALEQTTWGSHAKRHVRTMPRGAKLLRRRGLAIARAARPRFALVPTSIASYPATAAITAAAAH